MTDRSVKVTLRGDISDFNRAMLAGAATARTFTRSLDTSSDRMSNLVQTTLALAPALVPIGAAGVTAISGLANQLAFATAGAGVAAVAFQGVGDALGAVNDYQLEPTTANFEKLQQTMATLGPEGQHFVQFLQDLRPEMQELQNIAQAGLFPGLESGISDLMRRAPEIERIFATISSTIGDLLAEAGENLADPRWDDFFAFLEREARPSLEAMGRSLGNLTEGFAELWMAFQPLSSQFSTGFLDMSRDFAQWADELSSTEGFQSFLDYVERVGPKAGEALGAIGNALVALVSAAAPVGEVALPVIEAIADTLAAVANSPAGPVLIGVAAGMSALSRAVALFNAANASSMLGLLTGTASQGRHAATAATGIGRGFRVAGAGAGVFALSMTDLDDKIGLSNTAMGAALGLLAGPWGAAVGAGIGLALDFAAANDDVGDSLERANQAARDGNLSIQQRIAAVNAEIDAVKRLRAERLAGESIGTVAQSEVTGGTSTRRPDVGAEDAALRKLTATKRELIRADQEAAFAEAGLSGAMAGTSQATRDNTFAMLDRIRVHNELTNQLLGAFGAETAYREALKAANEQGRKNSAGIKGSSDAALENRRRLEALAGAWNRVAEAGGATQQDMNQARQSFIRAAISMGVGEKAARRLARELFNLPSPKPKITLQGVEGALRKISNVRQRLLSLDGTTAHTFVQLKESIADGGYIQRRRFDDGGRVNGRVSGPGGPRDDLIPAMISNGEFVVNAAATRKYLPELYAINAQRFAQGGIAEPIRGKSADPGPGSLSIDESLMARVVAKSVKAGITGATFDAVLSADGRRLQLAVRRG